LFHYCYNSEGIEVFNRYHMNYIFIVVC